jgi:hypothetical protein
MSVLEKSWEGVRANGIVLITVPACRWFRSVHEWELGRMRAYLREARQLPSEVRLEIFRWLEQQEASVETEYAEPVYLRRDSAEWFFWASLAAAAVSLAVLMFVAIGGGA